ncbi:hypothetical protein [Acidiphilium sp.]|uniref:hypothetical protein n=1 Tax=Acidiphilium sp. TaxID=527 RepID=UPI00258E2D58|nr:hypothetical protein [Acidiphilium sp.]
MTAKQHGLKKYIVRLSDDERAQLNALIGKGKHSAQKLLRARMAVTMDSGPLVLTNIGPPPGATGFTHLTG